MEKQSSQSRVSAITVMSVRTTQQMLIAHLQKRAGLPDYAELAAKPAG